MYQLQGELLKKIDIKRRMMVQLAKEKGIGSEETIRCSQELDQLIVDYQMLS